MSVKRDPIEPRLRQSSGRNRPRGARRRRRLGRLAAALVLYGAAAGARAGDAPADLSELSLEQILDVEVVKGASGYPQALASAPSAVSIVSAEEIRLLGYRTLGDVLASLRGFYTSDDHNYTYLGARGFGRPGDYNTRVLFLVDGHRINDAVFDSATVGQEFPLDLELVERVEAIRGPSSSLYGTSAFLGVVNVVTKRSPDLPRALASAGLASDRGYRGRLGYADRFANGVELLLSGSTAGGHGSRLYFPELGGVADGSDGERASRLFARVLYRDLTLQAALASRTKHVPTASFGTIFNDPRAATTDVAGWLDLRLERALGKRSALSSALSLSRYGYSGLYPYAGGSDRYPEAGGDDFLLHDTAEAWWWGGELQLTTTVAGRHKLTLGSEYRDSFRQDQEAYLDDPPRSYLDDHRSSAIWAGYVQDEVRLHRRIALTAGVRHDRYRSFGGTTNPRLGLILSPAPRTTVKLLYGRAFRAANAFETYYNDGGLAAPEPLRPERIVTEELVLEHDLGNGLRLAGSAYHYRMRDLISLETDGAGEVLVYRNTAGIVARGLEVELQGKWRGGRQLRASYAWQRSRDVASGAVPSNSPAHLAKLDGVLPLWQGRLLAGLELAYASPRLTLAKARTAGDVRSNLTLTLPSLLAPFALSASVHDLLDARAADPGSREHLQDVIPQDGRRFTLTIDRRF